MKGFINFVFFQSVWWATILGAANGAQWAGIVGVLVFMVVHLSTEDHRLAEIKSMAAIIGLGVVVDSILIAINVFEAPGWGPSGWVCTPWMIALWVNFSMAINRSLNWLKPRLGLAAFFGITGGPLTYFAGYKFGAVEMGLGVFWTCVVFAVVWAVLMPVICIVASKFYPYETKKSTAEPNAVKPQESFPGAS